MDLRELEAYRLEDAVKFHDDLNPRLWQREKLRPEVREALLRIADDFRQSLGLRELNVQDITISGSNAAYTYTPHSDIDLHLVVAMPRDDEVYRELFDAKKYQYNDENDFKIGGSDVELYVQDAAKPHVSQGIYSVRDDRWVRVPSRRRPTIDDSAAESKYLDIAQRIDQAIEQGDADRMHRLWTKIKDMRRAGLAKTGEFGVENLVFKVLRNNGTIERLMKAQQAIKNREMSLAERRRGRRRKSRNRWGYFGGMWYPGYSYGIGGSEASSSDGGGDGGESVQESQEIDLEPVLHGFIRACAEYLHMTEMPRVVLIRDADWTRENGTFGRYNTDTNTLELAINNRHPLDIIRTMAHEMTHARQNELTTMPLDAGRTGSPYEDEANALAGRFMRHVADHHPELFRSLPLEGSHTQEDYHPNNRPPGPETPPEMPQGTIKVDVSDMYDWYKLGMHISDMEGLGHHDFGQGPPQTVLSFGSEELEHKYLQDLKRLGLKTHDIDPGTHPGMKKEPEFGYKVDEVAARTPAKKLGEASGYIPVNDQEARDPRYSMALTQDIRPGETQRQAAKMGWKTDPAGRPPLLMPRLSDKKSSTAKKANDKLVLAEQLRAEFQAYDAALSEQAQQPQALLEVDMSPGALRSWANSEEAKNVVAGFEAEMVFRYAQPADDDDLYRDSEPYPDYDEDPRPNSIDDVIDFFSRPNEYTNNTRRDLERARDRLFEEYLDWVDSNLRDRWDSEKDEQIKEYMEDNVWRPEKRRRIESALEDMADVTDAAAVMNSESDQDKEKVQKATKAAREEFDQEVLEEIDNDMGATHDEAYQAWRDAESENFEQSDWLRRNYPYMSSVRESVDLEWPIWITPDPEPRGGRSGEDIGQSLEDVIPVGSVVVSTGYHSTTRTADRWIMEPDSSIQPNDDEDAGWEIVSPPMPLSTALKALRDVVDWAKGDGDAYTNRSTGLHMGVSVPSQETVDYVKLILFMGDKHVLDQFSRLSNTYCNSAMDRVMKNVKTSVQKRQTEPDVNLAGEAGFMDIPRAMELMRQGMLEIAGKTVKMNVGVDKYTSAHIKMGYIEFRSPGGNYLDQDIDALTNTMLRFARALSIASDPQAYRKEYAKKLYKVISPQGNDALQLFAAFSTGLLDKDDLKKEWNRIQALRVIKTPRAGADILWSVVNDWRGERITVRAPTRSAALDRAIAFSDENNMRWSIADLIAEPVRVVPTTPEPKAGKLPAEPQDTAQALDNRADSQQVQRTVQAPQAGDTSYNYDYRNDRETFELPQWQVSSNAEFTQAPPTRVLVRAANAQEALAYAREILGPRFDNVPNEQFTIAPVVRAQGDQT